MFIPHSLRHVRVGKRHTSALYCQWCCACVRPNPRPFTLYEGPITLYFCNTDCADEWAQYRSKPDTYKLLTLMPDARAREVAAMGYEDWTDFLTDLHLDVATSTTEVRGDNLAWGSHVSGSSMSLSKGT